MSQPDYEAAVAAHFDKDREVPPGTRGKTLQLVRAVVDAAIGERRLVSPTDAVVPRELADDWDAIRELIEREFGYTGDK